ncbi:MAG: sucrose phosphorylase [Clostridiales bacterium]
MENKIILITYPDSMSKNLYHLKKILCKYLNEVVASVHILPFYPSNSDRGFSPTTYDSVDEKFGTWEDIKSLSEKFPLLFDYMINHVSSDSKYFKDFKEKKEKSDYYDMFIKYDDFWPEGILNENDFDKIYKRKPFPYIDVKYKDGTSDKLWNTFTNNQIDIDFKKQITKDFIKDSLIKLAKKGASIIRLDAVAYTTKKPGTSCFFVEPDIWEVLEFSKNILAPYNIEVLPELHENYTLQKKLSDKGYWVYDFALPMILLHTLYSGSNKRIIEWLKICPKKQFTTLDTHDGIGVVDVKGILSDDEIENTLDLIYTKGVNMKEKYNSVTYNNVDTYQVNCTYYSALGNNDKAYLLARAIQFFTPGIPQVYYVGLFAGENDIDLIEKTKEGRNINRHFYTEKEIQNELDRSIVQKLFELMRFRNSYHKAFDGEFEILNSDENIVKLSWTNGLLEAVLEADLISYDFIITYYNDITKNYEIIDLNNKLKSA